MHQGYLWCSFWKLPQQPPSSLEHFFKSTACSCTIRTSGIEPAVGFHFTLPENVYSALDRHLARVRRCLILRCSLAWWYTWQMRTLKDAVCPPRAAEINHHKLVTTDCFPLLRMPEVLSKSFLVALIVDLWQHIPSFCLCLHMAFSSSNSVSMILKIHQEDVGWLYLSMGRESLLAIHLTKN